MQACKYGLGLLLVFATAAAAVAEDSQAEQERFFEEGIPGYDIVIAARTPRFEVRGTGTAATKGRVWGVATQVHVDDVIKGDGIKKGTFVWVLVSRPFPTEAEAKALLKQMNRGLPGLQVLNGVWGLRWSPPGSPTAYVLCRWVYKGRTDREGGPYVQRLKAKVEQVAPLSHVDLQVAVKPGVVMKGFPAQVSVGVYAGWKDPIEMTPGARLRLRRAAGWAGPLGADSNETPAAGPNDEPALVEYGQRGFPSGPGPVILEPFSLTVVRSLVRVEGGEDKKMPKTASCVAQLVSVSGVVLKESAPVEFAVLDAPPQGLDLEAVEAVTKGGLWPLMGPHEGRATGDKVKALREMLAKYGDTLLAPAMKCGLAFAREEVPRVERLNLLRELSRVDTFGFAEDCMLELSEQFRAAEWETEAERVLRALAARRPYLGDQPRAAGRTAPSPSPSGSSQSDAAFPPPSSGQRTLPELDGRGPPSGRGSPPPSGGAGGKASGWLLRVAAGGAVAIALAAAALLGAVRKSKRVKGKT